MKICFLSQEYPPETHSGGIGTYTYNTACALSRMGHTVHVITAVGGPPRTYEENGVQVHGVRRCRLRPMEWMRLRYAYAVARTFSGIPCSFDIVQASEFAAEAYWLARRPDLPLVTRLATPLFLTERLNHGKVPARQWFLNRMEKSQTLRSRSVFASTRALAGAVARHWGLDQARVEVIPNSIDLQRAVRLAQGPLPERLRGCDYLLYFGRLEERKGVRVLAEALPAILERNPLLRMVLVGSDTEYRGGSMRSLIRERSGSVAERVLFFDNLPQEELFPIVATARAVVLPSLWEAFGFVCVEALALGRPVVATSGSGFEEIIEHGVSGLLVPPGDSRGLSQVLLQALGDPGLLERLSENARRRSRDFEVGRVALRLVDYYRGVREAEEAGDAKTN